jgi:HNH endonuclease
MIRYEKNRLIELVKNSSTLKEVLLKLDILPVENNYKTLKKYLKKYNIDYSHFRSHSTNPNYSEENLKLIISNSFSFREVFDKLGLNIHGNNYKTIHKYIKMYNIDISHFDANKIRGDKLKKFNKLPNDKIFVENSTYNNGTDIKKRLYGDGLKERKCEICGQDENWHGEHMSLILDHINGINTDNRLENLRIVCPNCNATLPTHCGKNVKRTKKNKSIIKTNVCSDCGKTICDKSKLCISCEKKKKRKTERPSYEKLIEEINVLGYSATGRKYGVSDNAIRKWIKSYETN